MSPPAGRPIDPDGSPLPPPTSRRQPVQLVAQHPETAVDLPWRLAEILAEVGHPDLALLTSPSIAPEWLDRFPTSRPAALRAEGFPADDPSAHV